MKVKVSEAKEQVLDFLVAKAWQSVYSDEHLVEHTKKNFKPSTNWTQGGRLIERERIWLHPEIGKEGTAGAWYAVSMHNTDAYGPTPLIAAMRCYVVGILGDEVEVPDELKGDEL